MFQKLNKKLVNKKSSLIILILLFFLGLFLRVFLIDKNLFFGPEQGRDLLVIRDLVQSHKLVLIGPRTAVDGIFHGPLYYYIASIPFFLSKGNPVFIINFFIILSSLSVFLIFELGKELFSKRIGLIASLLFTFSFGLIVMARWLSHPPLIIPASCIFFLFLTRFLKGDKRYLIPTAILYGIVSQIEFSNFVIFTFVLLISVIVFWKKFLSQKILNLSVALFLAAVLPIVNFVIFDLRHNFLISQSILKSQAHRPGFISYFSHTLFGSIQQFGKVFSDVVLPIDSILVLLLFLAGVFCLYKFRNKYKEGVLIMIIWIFSPFLAFILLKYNPLYHYFASSFIAIIIITAALIEFIYNKRKNVGILLLTFLIIINIIAWINNIPKNKNIFFQTTQPDLKYSDEVAVINRIYKEANGKQFFFQAYTIPYWLQEGWQYLFWYHGGRYGYFPKQTNKGLLFVIIQPDYGEPEYLRNWLKYTVSKWGIRESQFRYGILTVEERYVE